MNNNFRRISGADIKFIIAELDKWALGHLGAKLTWAILEDRFKFSRQSMEAKPEIKAAYLNAKQALAGGLVKTKEKIVLDNDQLNCELQRLKKQIEEFQVKELRWSKRWQRIAYFVREKGIQVQSVDREIPAGVIGPSENESEKILKPFDKEIPSSGRV